MNAKEHAFAYARLGWPVFPLRRGDKVPATPHGFKDASTTIQSTWFNDDSNLGLATGMAFWVLDEDPAKGGSETLQALIDKNGPLPDTLVQVTRNGGKHYFFRADPHIRCGTEVLGPGLDHRGVGGYVVGAPSEVPANVPGGPGKYYFQDFDPLEGEVPQLAQAPEWLISLLVKPEPKAEKPRAEAGPKKREGSRNDYLSREAFRLRKQGLDIEAIFLMITQLNRQACEPPLPEQEVRAIAKGKRGVEPEQPPPAQPLYVAVDLSPINLAELMDARLTPRIIVPNLLYADVRTRFSAGGTGKTTLALYEAVCGALPLSIWGRDPARAFRTIIVTKEDSREILAARLREIMVALKLTRDDMVHVLDMVRIIDVSGEHFRLSAVVNDVVEPHLGNIDWLSEKIEPLKPDWLVFDPLVSFGVGEKRVNDAEHGLVEAFRVLRNRHDCCVEGIHHSGKANAREKTLDQYAGRGGSALSDGSRMVAVMQPMSPDEWLAATGQPLAEGETGIVMALPKLSYAGMQDSVYIRRFGYRFEEANVLRLSAEQVAEAQAEQVLQFILNEDRNGRRYGASDLENAKAQMGLTRSELRQAITALKVTGRIILDHVKGRAGSHYIPVTAAKGDGSGGGETHV